MEIEINNNRYPLWIIRLAPDKDKSFYIFVFGEDYTPIMKENKIIVFPEIATLKLLNISIEKLRDTTEIEIDICQILYNFFTIGIDLDSAILNSYNIITDFVINYIPDNYDNEIIKSMQILDPFADFITFDKDFGKKYIRNDNHLMEICSKLFHLFSCFFNNIIIDNKLSYKIYMK